jgi:hypothetical protein
MNESYITIEMLEEAIKTKEQELSDMKRKLYLWKEEKRKQEHEAARSERPLTVDESWLLMDMQQADAAILPNHSQDRMCKDLMKMGYFQRVYGYSSHFELTVDGKKLAKQLWDGWFKSETGSLTILEWLEKEKK